VVAPHGSRRVICGDDNDRLSPEAALNQLQVALESHLPGGLAAGTSTAVFCFGHCFHVSQEVVELILLVDGIPHRPAASRMPRRDLYEWLHVNEDIDPDGRSYRAGFWATVPVSALPGASAISLEAAIRLRDGTHETIALGSIPIVDASVQTRPVDDELIAAAMATFDPDPDLFATQIDSLRAQTDLRWTCVISDDCSPSARYEAMERVLDGDPRFVLSRCAERVGPYRNFERALRLALEAGAGLVALCDQDDRWYPDKLAALRAGLGDAQLAYCDQRVVGPDGHVVRRSLFDGRDRNHDNLASLLVANSVPGASVLVRRSVVERSLPFPDAPGPPYHDHWLALVALCSGEIAYINRPLYDYVQHSAAVTGAVAVTERARRASSHGLRGAYFGGYVARQVLAQTLLLRCEETLSKRERRALSWFIAAERSPAAFAWLALRPLRRLTGHDETLSGEAAIAKGLAWRRLLTVAVGRSQLPGRKPFDASFPDPPQFEQPRLRKWLAGT
jgi:hypothetical protein